MNWEKFLALSFSLLLFLNSSCSSEKVTKREQEKPASQVAVKENEIPAVIQPEKPLSVPQKIAWVARFEGETGAIVNDLGGECGDWNLHPEDINNSFTDPRVVPMIGKEGQESHVLSLTYSVDSDIPAQNGFWTKLKDFDASSYDHLEFEIKGDVQKGFTERFRIELKKCVDSGCVEKLKGSATIPVTGQWETVSIPLNSMTGLVDFSNPESWKNPLIGYKPLDELVIIFNDKFLTKKAGKIYMDNLRFTRTGNPGPSAVDFPPREKDKTPTRLEGLDYQRFLAKRLRGFPKTLIAKKVFPEDSRAFLKEIARDTWNFFDHLVDAEHALPLDTVQLGDKEPLDAGTWIGDYTNVTNIGVYLMALVSSYDMGFITREDAVQRIRQTMKTLEKVKRHSSGFLYNYYDTTMLDATSYFVSFVDSGWLMAGIYVVKNAFPDELDAQAADFLKRWDLSFFYDPIEEQMYHGYYDNMKVYSDYHYGVFYTEPRATNYMAVARGDVSEKYWFEGLFRTFPESYTWQSQTPQHRTARMIRGYRCMGGYYEWKGLQYVPSWGGSAFEALMSVLVLKEKELAPEGLGKNNAIHVEGQMRYAAEDLGWPVWGMSPCASPEGGYSEFGVKSFGVKGYKSGVVTPHASVIALDYAPEKVIANLRKLLDLYDIYGEYGFYDAVNVATGKVARKYLALDQAMILVAINNYLNGGAIRNRFHADPEMKKGEPLLTEEVFFDATTEKTSETVTL